MEFGSIPVVAAEGAILAHSVKAGAKTLKKGRTLSAGDIRLLDEVGIQEIIAAQLGSGDMHEDEAAAKLAAAVVGPHSSVAEAFTGRANIYAEGAGLALVDENCVNKINRLDEALTIATLPPFELVSGRQMLATVKIIPFALSRAILEKAVLIANQSTAVSVAPFVRKRAHLIISRLPQTKPSIVEKTIDVIRGRLEQCGAVLAEPIVCDHTNDAVASALSAIPLENSEPVLIFGASAIVDREDVIPAGLEAAQGEVVHLGMPVDPGNLLMYGRRGEAEVIGVPSCARSPKLNGFDWVLQRVLAGLEIRRKDIMGMGVGGLLKEIPSRPRPRERSAPEPAARTAPQIAAVVLAAGRSTRMGPENKLLKDIEGKPMVRRSVENLLASGIQEIAVVTGHEEQRVTAALEGLPVSLVHNPQFQDGLSTSLKAGVSSLTKNANGALVALGDMPFVGPALIGKLISAFDPEEGRGICVPIFQGKRGNPVLWGANYFEAMTDLKGDTGAKHLLAQFSEAVCEVESAERSVLVDFDTPEAFAELKAAG